MALSELEIQLASAIFWRRFFEVCPYKVHDLIAEAAVAGIEEILDTIRVDNTEEI